MTWKPGESGNPAGKPKGCREKLAEAFFRDLEHDWRVYGAKALVAAREENPSAYLNVIAKLMPKEADVRVSGEIAHEHRAVTETADWIAQTLNKRAEQAKIH